MAEYNDILGMILSSTQNIDLQTHSTDLWAQSSNQLLREVDTTLKQILNQGKGFSQSNAANMMPSTSRSGYTGTPSGSRVGADNYFGQQRRRGSGGTFLDGFEKSMLDALIGSDFKTQMQDVLGNFADELGVNIQDIPNEIGKELGKQAMSALKGTEIGKSLFSIVDGLKSKSSEWLKKQYDSGVNKYVRRQGGMAEGERASSFTNLMRSRSATKEEDSPESRNAGSVANAVREASGIAERPASDLEQITVDKIIVTGGIIRQRKSDQIREARIKAEQDKRAEKKIKDREPDAPDESNKVADAIKNQSETTAQDAVDNQPQEAKQLTDQLKGLKDKGLGKAQEYLQGKGKLGELGSKYLGGIDKVGSKVIGKGASFLGNIGSKLGGNAGALAGKAASLLGGGAATAGAGAAAGGAAAGGAALAGAGTAAGSAIAGLGGIAAGASAAFPPLLIAVAAVTVAMKVFGPLIEGASKMLKALGAAGNRETESRKKNLELAKKRNEADINVLIEKPFKILEEAVNEWYKVWDNNMGKINATQGYTKSDLQDLMASFSTRLKSEGLSDYIGATDISDNLAKVLDSGLSGKVAEEFAYLATILNKAVPTQDFYGYASTYASLAANAIRLGSSEAEAIEYANEQMESFASSVLYASRQISGGFTTGLKDAQSLFDKSVQIAQASKTGSASEIAGVMTSVAAITGSIAPDLAQSMTDVIMKAATGGNSNELIALRSLAGTGASNTEFIKALADNPQKVFSNLFESLANVVKSGEGVWMEQAESLSSLFGIQSEAFQRIDFNYLAQAVSNMNVNNSSLDENMKLLQQGQTTTTAESLKIQQINQKIIDEGLSYVIDNEAARMIQQNMWDEQRAREMMEATYAVELKGSALEFLDTIKGTIEKIINFLNPFSWFKKIGNMIATGIEAASQDADIRQILELGKVGSGNAQSMYQLTTRNAKHNVVGNMVDLMGGVSAYGAASAGTRMWNAIANPLGAIWGTNAGSSSNGILGRLNQLSTLAPTGSSKSANSQYDWGTISKSGAAAIANFSQSSAPAIGISQLAARTESGTSLAQTSSNQNIQRMVDDLESQIKSDKSLTYEKWVKTSRNYGISDFDEASKSAGFSETQLRDYFMQRETEEGLEEQNRRAELEMTYWNRMVFDSDSHWQLTFDGNLVRIEIRDELMAYHITYTELTTHANLVRDAMWIHQYESHLEIVTLTNLTHEILSRIELNAFGHYGTYITMTSETNTHLLTILSRMDTNHGYYRDMIRELQQANIHLDDMRTNIWVETNNILTNTLGRIDYFIDQWVDFNLEKYGRDTDFLGKSEQLQQAIKADEKETAQTLAELLTTSLTDFSNPTVQTNVLLAEIVKLLTAMMMQNNNKIDGLSLFDTLSGMSLGLTKTSTT